jgi:hypothetical protein
MIASDPSKANIFREMVDIEQNVTISVQPEDVQTKQLQAHLIFRFQYNRISNTLDMLEEAWLQNPSCSIFQLADLCKCVKKEL